MTMETPISKVETKLNGKLVYFLLTLIVGLVGYVGNRTINQLDDLNTRVSKLETAVQIHISGEYGTGNFLKGETQ